MFTFYKDKNFFLVRNVSADIPLFAANYPTPTQVALPSAGVQCACFTDDYSAVFILDVSGNIHLYNVIYETFKTLGPSSYLAMKKCYYDPSKNGVIFVVDASPASGTTLELYSMITIGSGGSQFIPEEQLTIDFSSTYIAMDTGSNVKVYQVPGAPCPSRQYYDMTRNPSCLPC